MSDLSSNDFEDLKQLFFKLKEGAEFYKMGPVLVQIMKHRDQVEISEAELKGSFTYVIDYRLADGKIDEALTYFVRSFGVDGIADDKRLEYARLLMDFLQRQEDQLVWADYQDIMNHLRKQIKYLQLYSSNTELVAELNSMEARLQFKKSHSEQREEGPMREYITRLMDLYYQHLPDEEALDYATQIILEK